MIAQGLNETDRATLLTELVAMARRHVRAVGEAEPTRALAPLILCILPPEEDDARFGAGIYAPGSFESDEDRQAKLFLAGQRTREQGFELLAVFVQAEIWTLPPEVTAKYLGLPRKYWPRPATHPERVERLALMGLTADRWSVAAQIEMIRRDGYIVDLGKAEVGNWRELEPGEETSLTTVFHGYVGTTAEAARA